MQVAAGIRIGSAFSLTAVGTGITTCAVSSADGSLSGCVNYPVPTTTFALDIAINGTDAYFLGYVSSGAAIFHCTLDISSGAISACAVSDGGLTGLSG